MSNLDIDPLRIGIGGPVGTGKTALLDRLCKYMGQKFNIAAITNDIYTKEDAEFLAKSGALPPDRILGVETGGCPHTAIREDASMNLAAVAEMNGKFPDLDNAICSNRILWALFISSRITHFFPLKMHNGDIPFIEYHRNKFEQNKLWRKVLNVSLAASLKF